MATQGIELPVSLQIKNLQEIANQIKQFASKNILSDSLGGKKIDQELGKVLNRLDQIQAKSKTALTTQGDFTSIQKDIDQVELGLNKIFATAQNLTFGDLKIPDDVNGQITALQARIQELQSSLISFKGTQKEKLINNQDFLNNLNIAAPTQAAKLLEKGYDELYSAIETGMNRVIMTLSLKNATYKEQMEQLSQNKSGELAFTQWGAIDYLSAAFKKISSNGKNDIQTQLGDLLKFSEQGTEKGKFQGFKNTGLGFSQFLKIVQSQFSFTDEQMAEIKARIKAQANELKTTQTEALAQASANPKTMGKLLFGDNAETIQAQRDAYAAQKAEIDKLANDISQAQGRQVAYQNLDKMFELPNKEIAAKAAEIGEALKDPQQRLKEYEATLTQAVANSPQLAQLFGNATARINELNTVVEQGKGKLQSYDDAINRMQGISNFVNRYVGAYAIIRRVSAAVRNAFNNIKELDKVITNIAVVTNMSAEDLWSKIGTYTDMAQQYGVATKDVYTVSQIFYQQGLQTSQVMSLTTETLKMAKISGMDYAAAANAMTVAIRAYKIEMSEAQQVTDTYSALAAKFAVSSAEIANAMEKTASSAANVGMSLQSTSAFISVMTQTTRESAQNIGSALKSIISRYGEMKASPSTLLNIDNEEVAFNKVDTALKSVGISIKDSAGQFRDFDDVIMELAQKWDSLDNNTQRYIATIMAGNRQQSRFIALVSNYDELNRAMSVASNAENTSIVQTAKTMDSLETKANQLKNAFSQLYLDLHVESGLKNVYDILTRIITTVGKLGTFNGGFMSLMNIFGFGSGLKSLFGVGKEWLTKKKLEVGLESDTAKKQAQELQSLLEQTAHKKVELDAEKAKAEANELNNLLKEQANLTVSSTGVRNVQTPVSQTPMPVISTPQNQITTNDFYRQLYQAQQNGSLASSQGRADLLTSLGVQSGTEKYATMNAMLGNLQGLQGTELTSAIAALNGVFTGAANAISGLQNAAEGATGAVEGNISAHTGNSGATEGNTQAITGNTGVIEGDSQALSSHAINSEASGEIIRAGAETTNIALTSLQSQTHQVGASFNLSSEQLQQAFLQMITKFGLAGMSIERFQEVMAGVASPADNFKIAIALMHDGISNTTNAMIVLQRSADGASSALDRTGNVALQNGVRPLGLPAGQTSNTGGQTSPDKGGASYKGGSPKQMKDKETGLSLKNWGTGNARAWASAGTAAARIFGTMIAAAGANMKDTSNQRFEDSKIWTGIGNGLSMGGTGASIGMMFGPGGAIVGGILGLLVGGVGAIFDGLHYTLAERIAAAKKEAEEAKNISLKSEAKVTELSSSIDNLETLQKAMYNSTDDMQAYTDAMNTMASQYPALVSSYDEAGNAIIDLNSAERELIALRQQSAISTRQAAQTEAELKKKQVKAGETLLAGIEQVGSPTYTDLGAMYPTWDVSTPVTEALSKWYKQHPDSNWTELGYDERQQAALGKVMAYKENLNLLNYEDILEFYKVTGDIDDINLQEILSKWQLSGEYRTEVSTALKNNWQAFQESIGDTSKTIQDYFGWGDNWENEINLKDLERAKQQVENQVSMWSRGLTTALSTADMAFAQEEVQTLTLSTDFIDDQAAANIISSNNVFSSWFYEYLKAKMNGAAKTLDEWKEKDPTGYDAAITEAREAFINNFKDATKNDLERFLSVTSNLTKYTSAENAMAASGMNFEKEDWTAFQQLFIRANQANRDRILKLIWGENYQSEEKPSIDNTVFKNLKGSDALTGFGNMFNNSWIISDYAQYVSEQLLNIDKLAEQGYTVQAKQQLSDLWNIFGAISYLDDKQQADIFGTITDINFSSYDSIISASKKIKEYGESNGVDVNLVIEQLSSAANNLVFNINTLAQELTTKITNAAKEIDSILTTNKSGLTFDKAIEAFNKLAASYDKITNFDQIFTYDAALGKYIYTSQGLQTAIAAQEQELIRSAKELEETAGLYENLPSLEETAGLYENLRNSLFKNSLVTSNKELQGFQGEFADEKALTRYLEKVGIQGKQLAAFQNDAVNFMADEKYEQKTWEAFLQYLQEQATDNQEAAEAAQKLLAEYQANKKNQLFGAIDWSKLALGTDYSGTNQKLVESLALELDEYSEDVIDEATGEIRRQLRGGVTLNWEKVQQSYLDQYYGTDEALQALLANEATKGQAEQKIAAKKAAEAALNGQIKKSQSDQISTAITEILNGTGQILSDATIALVQNRTDLTIDDGVITAGGSFVNTALELYDLHKDNLLTLAEKNNTYSSILNKQFEQSNQVITALSSGASLDMSALADTFTKFNKELSEYYVNGAWTNGLENVLTTDIFGKTQILDWKLFLTTLKVELSNEILTSFEYQNAYSSYVDGIVTLDTQMNDLIKKNYDNAFSSITEWKPLNISKFANSTMFSQLAEEQIIDPTAFQKGELVVKDAVAYAQRISRWFITLSSYNSKQLYDATGGWTSADLAKNWKNAQTVLTSVQDVWMNLAENITSLNIDNIGALIEKGGFNLSDLTATTTKNENLFTKIGDTYALRLDAYQTYLLKAITGKDDSRIEDLKGNQLIKFNEAYYKAEQAIIDKINGLEWSKILDNTATASERDTFAAGLQESLASLGVALETYYWNSTLNLSGLIGRLQEVNSDISNEIIKNITANIAETRDNILSNIDTAMSYTISGTNSMADIQKFIDSYNKLPGLEDIDISAFGFDEALGQFTLSGPIVKKYIDAQREVLEQMGMSGEAINTYIESQTSKLLQQEMDITSILDDSDKNAQDKALQSLTSLIESYLDLGNKIFRTATVDEIAKYNELENLKRQSSTKDQAKERAEILKEYEQQLQHARELNTEQIIAILYNGGEEAVKILQQLKGKELTSDEISAVYNASINRINTALEDIEKGVGEIITQNTYNILSQVVDYKFKDLGNGQYVITAVGNMAAAYMAIYNEMAKTANHTIAGLNNVYAKVATAIDQKNIDMRDTLTSAFDMSYESLAELINKYSPNTLLKNVLANPGAYGLQMTGFGSVNIVDFGSFAELMGWEQGSPQFLEYYSQYIDDLIEVSDKQTQKALQDHVKEQILAISKAKPGSQVNVSYLESLFGSDILNTILTTLGMTVKDGIATLTPSARIPEIIASIQRVAAETEALLPEQLTELSDTLSEFFNSIINLIKNGINGSLSNVDALNLQDWASEHGLGKLQFTQTAEGLKLTADSLVDVYTAMKEVDAIQAQSLLPDIQSADSRYKSLISTLRELNDAERMSVKQNSNVKSARSDLQDKISAAIVQGTVETDFYLRPHIINEDEFVETYISSSFSDAANRTVVLTPILPDGTKLTDAGLQQIAEQYLNGEIDLNTKLVGEDNKELKYTLREIFMGLYDSVEAADAAAEAYHNYHESIMSAESDTKSFNQTINNTTTLMRDLVRSMMTDPDQFNFMSTSLPGEMQSVVNAFENASAGIKALTEANAHGYMGVQDFYNIVTTASQLMEAAGQEFYINGMTASQLMEAAGENLKIVDGKLTVDLSEAGLDIVGGGVDQLKNNLHTGIQELAKAEVEMLDAEIQVLEVLAAMEAIGDVDVNGNGIAFEIDDMFEWETLPDNTKVRAFNSAMINYLDELDAYAKTNTKVMDALNAIKIGNKSLYELVTSKDWGEWQAAGFTEETLSQFLQTLTTMDWDVDNIQSQVADVLAGLSVGVSVNLKNGLYVFSITGELFSFEWDNEETMSAAQSAIEQFWGANNKTTQETIEELVQQYLTGKNTKNEEINTEEKWKIRMTLALASGEITLKDEGNGLWSARYGNNKFSGTKEQVIEDIGHAMGYENEGMDYVYEGIGSVKGKITVGTHEIIVDDSEDTRKYLVGKESFGTEEQAFAYLASQGIARSSDAGKSFTTREGETWNVYTDADTNLTYTVKQGNEPKFVYDNQPFDTYDELMSYLQFRSKGAGGTVNPDNSLEINFESGLKMTFDLNTGTINYSINDKDFASEQEAMKYLEATKKPGAVVSDTKDVITYSFNGYQVQAKFNVDTGTVTYTMQLPDGVVEAADENSLKAAIAAHTKPQGGETNTEADSGVNYTYTTKGGIIVRVTTTDGQANADVENAGDAGQQIKTDTETVINEYLSKNKPQAEANVETHINADEITQDVSQIKAALNDLEEALKTSASTIASQSSQISSSFSSAMDELETRSEEASASVQEHLGEMLTAGIDAVSQITEQIRGLQQHVSITFEGKIIGDLLTQMTFWGGFRDKTVTVPVGYEQEGKEQVEDTKEELEAEIKIPVGLDPSQAESDLGALRAQITTPQEIPVTTNIDNTIQNQIDEKSYTATVKVRTTGGIPETPQATGNLGLARAKGTLMGELGPELVVSNGRYFVAGQNGAEMVDLADDAIVFNHLQTEQLLKNGMSSGRGRAVTNEYNAVAFAHGNVNGGPAKASASEALAALKKLRAMWESLAEMSVKDLVGKGGGGGGGGGGNNAAFIKQLERWYDLLQQIARLEQQINYEEAKRSKISSSFIAQGKEYFQSQQQSLDYLKQEVQKHKQLSEEQQKYFEKRREELNKQSAFSKLYTFDEYGQLQYQKGAFKQLTERFGADPKTGEPKYSVKQQYEWLKQQGYGFAMEYDSSGKKIDTSTEEGMSQAIQAFWDKIETDRKEMQDLHDSVEEHKKAVLEKQQAMNEIMKEIEDNQISVENKVLKAMEDSRQREIDELQKQTDAIREGNEALINGLNEQLDKERKLYENQKTESDLESKRRRLAILQRSGGSASEISSLQQEIDEGMREEYFTKQQEQIDALQEASDNQIEKLEQQIKIMTETLEYEKANGLLWDRVYDVMRGTPEDIAKYIQEHDSDYFSKSTTALAQATREDLFEAQQWKAFADLGITVEEYAKQMIEGKDGKKKTKDKDKDKDKDKGGKDEKETPKDMQQYVVSQPKDTQVVEKPKYKYKYSFFGIEYDTKKEAETAKKQLRQYWVDQYKQAQAKGEYDKSGKYQSKVLEVEKMAIVPIPYSTGGYDYETGLAMLHGTPSKPEAVLNAEQTKVLRDNILGNRPDSLVNLLQAYNDAYQGLSSDSYNSTDASVATSIEKVEINMNVSKINDKYDTKQVGQDVMRELLSISNKTSARNKITRG